MSARLGDRARKDPLLFHTLALVNGSTITIGKHRFTLDIESQREVLG